MAKVLKNNKPTKNKFSQSKKKKSRKELRKEQRIAKKERKNQHFLNKFLNSKNVAKNVVEKSINRGISSVSSSHPVQKKKQSNCNKNNVIQNKLSFEKQSLDHKNELKEKKLLEKEMKIQRKKQLLIENRNEDKVIRKLAKQLRLNKRKSKTLPQSFLDEGLDYLLDVCDSEKIKNAVETEKNLQDSESEFEEDFAVVTGRKKEKIKSSKNKYTTSEDEFSECDDEDDSESVTKNLYNSEDEEDEAVDDDDNASAIDFDTSEDDEPPPKKILSSNKIYKSSRGTGNNISAGSLKDENYENDSDISFDESDDCGDSDDNKIDNIDDTKKNKGTYEDIYGRKRDKEGNLITETEKYIPPHLKAKLLGDSGREEQLARLKKQIKGLLNRLAENNMYSIVSQMDNLFMQNSRNDMNDTLTKLLFESLIQHYLVPERLIVEHTMLIAALQANVGTEVGAHFLQAIVEKFHSTYRANIDISDKEVDNILLIIAYLYSFKVFNCALMFDILNLLTEVSEFGEKEVELLLIVLRGVGFNLRKDNPIGVKNIILKVQSVVNNSDTLAEQSRVRFMLDVLTAIKNNNTSKIPNYDPSQMEHHKKVLKSIIQKGKYLSELNITLEDLLKAPERGRWWVVGSAWSGSDIAKKKTNPNDSSNNDVTDDINKTYLDLAKKHRMSTEIRQNIFCIIMSAEDYMDAFEKLLRLGLKGSQEQTIIHVIVHCVVQEKTFNPYYAYLASQFCTVDRKYLITFQYHLWDRIRELSDLKGFQITNLALFLSHLVVEKALPLSVLKVIEFASLSKPYVRLLRRIFLTILLHKSDETVAEIFQKISRAPKLKLFRESVRLFFHHFILKNINSEDSTQMIKLKERVTLAENCMNFL